jgi:hypothetical protein
MGLCLSRDLLERSELKDTIESAAREQRTRSRFLILDPSSEVAAQRAREEAKRGFLPTIEQSLLDLQAIKRSLGQEIASTHFQIKVVTRSNIYFRIVRTGDVMGSSPLNRGAPKWLHLAFDFRL